MIVWFQLPDQPLFSPCWIADSIHYWELQQEIEILSRPLCVHSWDVLLCCQFLLNQIDSLIYVVFLSLPLVNMLDSSLLCGYMVPNNLLILRGVWILWTQIFLKHIKCCNFQTITLMYIKVYISGIKMSQKIRFWYQILLKVLFFWENGKKSLFCSKFFVTS